MELKKMCRSEFKYATVTPPSGWAEQQNSLSSDGVPCSDKPSRKFVKFDEGFESGNLLEAEALWAYTSWNEEELTFNAGDVIMVSANQRINPVKTQLYSIHNEPAIFG